MKAVATEETGEVSTSIPNSHGHRHVHMYVHRR